jgi:hypothetical protein
MSTIYTDENGREFTLPNFDDKITKLDEEVAKADGFENIAGAEYKMLCAVLPKDYLSERLEGKTFASVDRFEVRTLFHEVAAAYKSRFERVKSAAANERIAELKPLIDAVNTMQETKAPTRQAFQRVK